MKNVLTILLLTFTFISCEKKEDDIPEIDNSTFWSPDIGVEKGNKQVNLYLSDPRPYTLYQGNQPSDPEYFEIFYSTDLNSFTLFKRVDFSIRSITIPNLINGEPYYFTVSTHKSAFEPILADTLMSVPSANKNPEEIFTTLNLSIERVLYSQNQSYISLFSNATNQYYGMNMLFYKLASNDSLKAIEKDAYGVDWANSSKKFTYVSTTELTNVIYPAKLKIFDVELETESTVLDIDFNRFYATAPIFSANDQTIYFLSSEQNSNRTMYDMWNIDISTKIKSRVSNFQALGFVSGENIDLSSNGEYIYLDGTYNTSSYINNIYKLNTSTGELFPVIDSPWNDKVPNISPDDSKLAFISNRTGSDELWVFNVLTSKYQQISTDSAYQFDSRYTNIQWLNNNELIVTLFKDRVSTAVKLRV